MKFVFLILLTLLSNGAFAMLDYHHVIKSKLIAEKPIVEGNNIKVWQIKKTDLIRVNLVEFSEELGLHSHPDAEHSIMVFEGEVKVQINKDVVILKKGDFISIPQNAPHKYWSITEKSIFVSMDAPYYDPKKTIHLEK